MTKISCPVVQLSISEIIMATLLSNCHAQTINAGLSYFDVIKYLNNYHFAHSNFD